MCSDCAHGVRAVSTVQTEAGSFDGLSFLWLLIYVFIHLKYMLSASFAHCISFDRNDDARNHRSLTHTLTFVDIWNTNYCFFICLNYQRAHTRWGAIIPHTYTHTDWCQCLSSFSVSVRFHSTFIQQQHSLRFYWVISHAYMLCRNTHFSQFSFRVLSSRKCQSLSRWMVRVDAAQVLLKMCNTLCYQSWAQQ